MQFLEEKNAKFKISNENVLFDPQKFHGWCCHKVGLFVRCALFPYFKPPLCPAIWSFIMEPLLLQSWISWNILSLFMCGSCHFARASNDKFSVEFWMCGWSTTHSYKGALTQRDNLIPWRCPKLQNLVTIQTDDDNKYSTNNANFNIRRPVQMTWLPH